MLERRFRDLRGRLVGSLREIRMSRTERIGVQLEKMIELVRPSIQSGTELTEDIRMQALGMAKKIISADDSLASAQAMGFRLLQFGVENPDTRAIILDLFTEVTARDIARLEERKTGMRVDWRDIKRAINDTNTP